MSEFLLVLGIAAIAAFLTYLGAPLAERYDAPQRLVSAALQFAAGLIIALVVVSLMPLAVRHGQPVGVVLGFFVGGALFVTIEYYSAVRAAAKPEMQAGAVSLGLYVGILADLMIDGAVIGIGSSLTLQTGLLLAISLAVGTAPLAFVTIATAKRQGMPPERRRQLSYLFIVCLIGGAAAGYLLLRGQPIGVKMVIIALASGFLITMVTQSMIPEANRDGEPSFAGILFMGGLSLYTLSMLALQ